MLIREALDLPQVTALDEFITRLDDSEERVKQSLEQFVLAEKVQEKLDAMLADVGERLEQGRDMGRFIYGTFGSGKSHLMTVLGKMFERDETVYAVGDPALSTLRARHAWLDKHRTLVVRLNMMDKASLVTALYNAFNLALPASVPKLAFTNEQQVFELIEQDAQRYYGGIDALVAKRSCGSSTSS
jgi:ABC-type lipoprotein export system ATPase subunit